MSFAISSPGLPSDSWSLHNVSLMLIWLAYRLSTDFTHLSLESCGTRYSELRRTFPLGRLQSFLFLQLHLLLALNHGPFLLILLGVRATRQVLSSFVCSLHSCLVRYLLCRFGISFVRRYCLDWTWLAPAWFSCSFCFAFCNYWLRECFRNGIINLIFFICDNLEYWLFRFLSLIKFIPFKSDINHSRPSWEGIWR